MLRNLNKSSGGRRILGVPHVGIIASQIISETATGDNGAGLLYDEALVNSGKQLRLYVTSAPSSGTLFAHENGSFELDGAADGSYTIGYQYFVDNVLGGSDTATVTVGAANASAADGGVGTSAGSGSGGLATVGAANASAAISALLANAVFAGNAHQVIRAIFSATTANATFSGGAHPASAASFAATTAGVVFSGNAHPSGVIAAVFSATTADAVFSGRTVVSPKTLISATLNDAVFMGEASAGVCAALLSAQTANARFTGSSSSAGGGISGSLSEADVARIAAAVLQAIASLQPTTISVVVANRDQIAADVWGFTL